MATVTSSFSSAAAMNAAAAQMVGTLGINAAHARAQTAFNNALNAPPSAYTSATSTQASGVLGADSFSVVGSNLLSYPRSVSQLDYTFGSDGATVRLVGGILIPGLGNQLVGSLTSEEVSTPGAGKTTLTINFQPGSFFAAFNISQVVHERGGATLSLAGALLGPAVGNPSLSGDFTSGSLSFGGESMSFSDLALPGATLFSSADQILSALLSGNDQVTGTSTANYLAGFAGSDTLFGLDGNDTIDGGTGADEMHGGTGSDDYFVDATSDRTIELASQGFDTAYISVGGFILEDGSEVERLVLTGTAGELTGNALANILVGNASANVLNGGGGDDSLDGAGGADILRGGEGNDFYRIDDASVTVEDSGGSADYVQSSVDFALGSGSGAEILQLTGAAANGTGNELANTMLGNGLANTFQGMAGNDTVGGGDGNDTLYGDAGEDQLYGERGDDVLFGGDDYDLIFGGEGNDLIVGEGSGDIVFAQSGNDLVDGGAGTDVLFGQEDNDVIFGDAADDQLIGGSGNDTMMGERGGTSLTGGNDWIYGDTEVLSLAGGDDLINGGGGNDVIVGGGGTDVIDGGHGNDIVEGNAGTDILVGSASSIVGAETTGSDLFIYRAMTDAGDSIYGFDIRAGDNDGIDLRALFDALGYAGMDARADGFLRIQQSGANAAIEIDADGAANGANFVAMITLMDRNAVDITDGFFLFQ